MKKIISSSLIIVCTMFFLLVVSNTTSVNAEQLLLDELNSKTIMDMGIVLREERSDHAYLTEQLSTITNSAKDVNFNELDQDDSASTQSEFTYYGGTKYFVGINFEFIEFHLRSVGENVEVWVADDLSYGYDKPADVITQEQVDKMRDEFENQIYPTNTNFFGKENYHDGSNSAFEEWGVVPEGYYSDNGKNIILVENIKDDSYYQETKTMVAGFYWNAFEYYMDRNIITVDSYNWSARMTNDNPNSISIFATVAHEFQHLIHDDNDPNESLWINEGMANFAIYLNGYGHVWRHINEFIKYPENSLMIWGDYYGSEILADYGQAYLLQLYLYDHFGEEFIKALAKDMDQGIESINKILAQFNTGIDFEELFERFMIAVAIDSNQPGNGIYEFDSIDVRVNFDSAALYEKDNVPAWGGDYKIIEDANKIDKINLNGVKYFQNWEIYNDVDKYSGNNNYYFKAKEDYNLDDALIMTVDLTNVPKATLEFDQYMNTYYGWNYGFVQVSLDQGKTWESLSNFNTTYDLPSYDVNSRIESQLPGFTGWNYGFNHEYFDLTPYVGNEIMISFRYMTNEIINYDFMSGWFIDNISIPELNYYNDCSSLDGFIGLNELNQHYVEYTATFINEKVLPNGQPLFKVITVDSFNMSETETLQLRQLFKEGKNYMVVWYQADENNMTPVSFNYEIVYKK